MMVSEFCRAFKVVKVIEELNEVNPEIIVGIKVLMIVLDPTRPVIIVFSKTLLSGLEEPKLVRELLDDAWSRLEADGKMDRAGMSVKSLGLMKGAHPSPEGPTTTVSVLFRESRMVVVMTAVTEMNWLYTVGINVSSKTWLWAVTFNIVPPTGNEGGSDADKDVRTVGFECLSRDDLSRLVGMTEPAVEQCLALGWVMQSAVKFPEIVTANSGTLVSSPPPMIYISLDLSYDSGSSYCYHFGGMLLLGQDFLRSQPHISTIAVII